jgi:hypothetical protein
MPLYACKHLTTRLHLATSSWRQGFRKAHSQSTLTSHSGNRVTRRPQRL